MGGLFMGCKKNIQDKNEGTYFFKSCNLYVLPVKPAGEISMSDIKQYSTYYEAKYNNKGNLIELKKILRSEIVFTYKYIYDNEGNLIEYSVSKRSEPNVVKVYNVKGDLLRVEK